MLGRVLNDAQRRMMTLLASRGEVSLTDITREIGLSKPTVSKHLKDLQDLGFVSCREERTAKGREMRYSLNRYSFFLSIVPESSSVLSIETQRGFNLQRLLLEQVHDDEFLRDLKTLLDAIDRARKAEQPLAVILFGSVAEGKGNWKSDIDVAVIRIEWGAESKAKAERLVSDVNMRTKHQIKPQYIDRAVFELGRSTLIEEIKSSGVVIFGDIGNGSVPWREMRRYRTITGSA